MFIPDQAKTGLDELLGGEKTLRKLKKSHNTGGRAQPSVFGGVGDLDLGEGCGDSSCHSRHDRRESQRNAAKAISALTKKSEETSYRRMLLGGIFLLAMSGGLFTTVWTIVDYLTGASLYPFVNVKTDEAKLKEIFFSGEPYVVYCQAGQSKLVPKLLIEGANMLPRGFSTAMLNCGEVMPSSGKSVYERFELDPKDMPAFVVANGEKPKQYNRNSFYNMEYFAEFAKNHAVPKMKEVGNEIQFRNYCTEKSKCVAIGHKGKLTDSTKASIESTMTYFRKQRFASIDTGKFAIKLDDVLSASLDAQIKDGRTGKGYLSGLCVSMPDRSVDTHSPVKAMVKRVTESELYYFVKDCMADVGLQEIKKVPTLDFKVKKAKKDKSGKEPKQNKAQSAPPKQEQKPSQYADDGMEVEDVDDDE